MVETVFFSNVEVHIGIKIDNRGIYRFKFFMGFSLSSDSISDSKSTVSKGSSSSLGTAASFVHSFVAISK